jgi:hypothetical protein
MSTPSSKPKANNDGQEQEIVLERRGFKHVEICNPSPAVLDAVRLVGENDPAICLEWNIANLLAAVDWANNPANQPALQPWYPGVTAATYPIDIVGIQQ